MTSTSVGNQVLSSNTYLPNNGLLSTSTYGNGDSVSYTYDNLYRTTGKSYDGQTAFTYVYDAYGNLARTTDLVNNVTYTYQYDMVGRTTGMDSTQGQTLRVSYDDKNRTDYVVSKVGDTSTKTQYVYGETENGQKTGLIYGVKVDDQDAVSYTYDELARLSSRTLNIGHNNGLTTFYEYLDGNSVGMTTPLVSKISMGMTGWNYTYDSRGNIETIGWGIVISPNPFWHWRYYYDELNQLVREDNEQQNKTITYSYDVGGNITSRTEYPYTTGELGTPTATITYSYDDSNWKDKLTSYNGSLITYDEIGNPLIYHDGKQFTWQHGRQMTSLHDEGLSVSYTYDDSGIRTSKTVNGTKTQYYLNGSTILTQITGDDRLDFFYDENGLLIGFSYNGEKYYYIRNLQNDIVAIYDSNANQVVSYQYDSWGKLLSIDGSAKDTIGVLNPFRYRGYYYDTESGFYYLNSRYYDPGVGRFLNADSVIPDVGGNIKGYNVFVYCINDPTNMVDSSGFYPKSMRDKLATYEKAKQKIQKTTNTAESSSNVNRAHITTPTLMFDAGPGFGKIGFSTTTTVGGENHNPAYTYVDVGNDETQYGAEIAAGDWLGIGCGVSSNINFYINMQISPIFHLEGSIGLDGIGLTAGLDINKVAYDFEVKGGWGTILLFFTGQYVTSNGAINYG